MPRTIQADGRTITVPDDATAEEINQIVGPPQVSVRAAPAPFSPEGIKGRLMTLRDKAINQLPAIGGAVGGILGAGGGIESGPGALATGTLGAAAGGGLGEDLRQSLTEHFHPEDKRMSAKESAEKMAGQAAAQGASEFVGRGIGGIFRPATSAEKLSFVGDVHPHTVQRAYDELVKTERLPGNRVLTVGDYLNVLKQTKQRIGSEVSISLRFPVKTPHGPLPLGTLEADTTPVSQALSNLAFKHPSELQMNPAKLKMFRDRALDYQKNRRSYAWLFDRRQVLNEELNRFEALDKGDKAIYLSQHPNLEADKAEADAIRDVIYPKMDAAAGKPQGYFRDLQRKYGSVIETEGNADAHIKAVQKKGAMARGGPVSERMGASGYIGESGKPGFAVHRLPKLLAPPRPEKALDKAAKSAFGHSLVTKAGKAISSNPGVEVLSLPLRELFTPGLQAPRRNETDDWANQ